MSILRRSVAQLKFEYRALAAREPLLSVFHRPIVWWTQYKTSHYIDPDECLVQGDTEFVLDGFQGSGNSFATVAFKHAQTRPVRLAHHLHAPAQIIKAVDAYLPTLVTIREPADAVVSLVSRWTDVSLKQGLRSYAGFYEKIEPYAHGFVLSPFSMTIRHLDLVFMSVNEQFGADFDVFRPTTENVRAVRGPRKNRHTPVEQERKQRKDFYRNALLTDPTYRPLIARAEAVYDRLLRHHAVDNPADTSKSS